MISVSKSERLHYAFLSEIKQNECINPERISVNISTLFYAL
jgi:hypothetical protein